MIKALALEKTNMILRIEWRHLELETLNSLEIPCYVHPTKLRSSTPITPTHTDKLDDVSEMQWLHERFVFRC